MPVAAIQLWAELRPSLVGSYDGGSFGGQVDPSLIEPKREPAATPAKPAALLPVDPDGDIRAEAPNIAEEDIDDEHDVNVDALRMEVVDLAVMGEEAAQAEKEEVDIEALDWVKELDCIDRRRQDLMLPLLMLTADRAAPDIRECIVTKGGPKASPKARGSTTPSVEAANIFGTSRVFVDNPESRLKLKAEDEKETVAAAEINSGLGTNGLPFPKLID
ncbi:hypothetical protein HK102_005121 [Quaeritorhiza haematococci]|nr:hypothetical protein HK102_005121 [Quaeritorhiza haematococci]